MRKLNEAMDSKHKTVLGDAAPVKDIFANDMWKVNEPAKEEVEDNYSEED